MRQYLADFMQRCAYPTRDASCLLAAYDAVMAETETQAVWESLLAIYEADIHCDYGFLRAEVRKLGERLRIHAYTMELLLFLGLSRYTQKRYAERGLSEHLFFHIHKSQRDIPLNMCASEEGN